MSISDRNYYEDKSAWWDALADKYERLAGPHPHEVAKDLIEQARRNAIMFKENKGVHHVSE